MSDRSDSSSNPRPPGGPGWEGARWSGGAADQRPRQDGPGAVDGALGAPAGRFRPETALERFLGGSPVAVFFRLLIVSLVVGALLMWLDIRPLDILHGLERFLNRLWMMGFDVIRESITYILAGAVIVVPVWFVLRLMNMRGRNG